MHISFNDAYCNPEADILLMEEIRRSPVEVGSLSHYLQGLINIQTVVGLGISEPSTVAPTENSNKKTR